MQLFSRVFIPKGLHNKAQGRASRTLGIDITPDFLLPRRGCTSIARQLCNPFGVKEYDAHHLPRVREARPWALLCNPFGVNAGSSITKSVALAVKAYLFALFAFVSTASLLTAAEPKDAKSGKISYYKDVRPIFQQHCQGCHQPAKAGGGFNMTVSPTSSKKAIATKRALFRQAGRQLSRRIDPPQGRSSRKCRAARNRFPNRRSRLIVDWIAQGAADDTPASARASLIDQEHPPSYRALPVVTSVAFSPDGQWLAVAGYHEVLLHKADGSGLEARLVGLSERIQSLAFSPDGK